MRFIFYLFIFLFTGVIPISAQFGKWQNHTNQSDVNSIVFSKKAIWAATSGGVFGYFDSNRFEQLNLINGLPEIFITSITVDKFDRIWFGSKNGYLTIYDVNSKTTNNIYTIANSVKTKKQINKLVYKDNIVYVCSDFGISLVDVNNLNFGDTYNKLGSFGTDTKVNDIFILDTIWVATERGIAVQKSNRTNYLDPNSWWNFTINLGATQLITYSIEKFKDTIFVGTSSGLYFFNGRNFQALFPLQLTTAILTLKQKGDSLLILLPNGLFAYHNGNLISLFSSGTYFLRDVKYNESGLFIASNRGLIKLKSHSDFEVIYPPGPNSNFFPSLAVDNNGNLWAASGRDVVLKGFYKLSKDGWMNYTTSNYPELGTNAYHKIKITSNNTIWALGWGAGLTRIKNDTLLVRFHRENVNGLNGVVENPNFIVIKGLAEDSEGNIWILNYKVSDNKILARLSKDSVWTFYVNELNPSWIYTEDLVIDQYDTKWILLEKSGQIALTEGVVYFNDKGRLPTTWGIITKEKFGSNPPTCIAIDLRNEIWVGTTRGLFTIANPLRPDDKVYSNYITRLQFINCITIDALNYKWIGTQNGVWVLSPDGSTLIAQYNKQNSPIPDDNIKSIAIDNETGIVYIGTDYGLASLVTLSIKPKESFSKLKIFPNPFYVENGGKMVCTIDGLMKNSSIKILSSSGDLVNEFKTYGGRVALWNGLDKNLNPVPSGVYFIVASNEDGETIRTGKVAVIRK